MTKDELKERYRVFALRIIKLVDAMPNTISSMAIARQIIRSGTSPSANYRAACIAKSDKDFLNKLKQSRVFERNRLACAANAGFKLPLGKGRNRFMRYGVDINVGIAVLAIHKFLNNIVVFRVVKVGFQFV